MVRLEGAAPGDELGDQDDETRLTLLACAEDFAREFRDQAPLSSTTTRLVNLQRAAGLDLDRFIDRMLVARAITQERTPAIRTRSDGIGPKPKMPYFLAVLADVLEQPLLATGTADD